MFAIRTNELRVYVLQRVWLKFVGVGAEGETRRAVLGWVAQVEYILYMLTFFYKMLLSIQKKVVT